MKKKLIAAAVIFFIYGIIDTKSSRAFDLAPLSPIQPYGTFSTFSAYTLGKGKLGVALTLEKSIEPNFFRVILGSEYGLFENIDFVANFAAVLDFDDDEGIEGLNIGFKHHFLREKRSVPSLSYLVSISIPGKDRFSAEGRYGGGIIITKSLGPFEGNLNLLYYKSTDSSFEDEVELRIGLDLAAAHNFNVLGELIVKKSHFSENIDSVEGRVGYRVKISSKSFALLGLGYDFKNRNPELRLFFSLNIFYPFFERDIKRIYVEANS
jgi:hypothetical protein